MLKKIIVSNNISYGKNDFKCFIGYKNAKKLDLYSYFFQKWVHIEEIFMKCMSFLIENENHQKNTMNFGKKSATLSKKNLAAVLYTIKNM